MNCFGLCGSEKKPNEHEDFRVVYNKADDRVVIETQTSKPELPLTTRNTAAIIDCGSCNLRAGFAGDEDPLITIPTVVGKSVSDNVTRKVYGLAALASANSYKLTYPVEKGFIYDWHDAADIFEHVIDNHLRIDPKMNQLIFIEPPNNSTNSQEKIAEMIFEKFEFNSFLLVPSTPMGMLGYGATTGVMVESGAGQTHIMAIKDGDCIRDSYRHIPLGGNDLSLYMGELLRQSENSRYFQGKRNELEILNEIKETGCHIVVNYEEEMKKIGTSMDYVSKNAVLSDGTTIDMRAEAFQVPELLFKPEMISIQTGGIPENIYECIESCDPDLKEELYANIYLCGGNTMFEGIEDRLLWEVKAFAGHRTTVIVNAPPNRDNLVFLGASLVGVCPRFRDTLISYQEYREVGPEVARWRVF